MAKKEGLRPIFVKQCNGTGSHETHTFVFHHEKKREEPLGWFPPGSYASMPDGGWDSTYRCRGLAQTSRDVLPDGRHRYDVCDRCNYDRHECPGCGTPLSHDGYEKKQGLWVKHGTQCVD